MHWKILEQRDGDLWVVYHETDYDKPTKREFWYRVTSHGGLFLSPQMQSALGKEVKRYTGMLYENSAGIHMMIEDHARHTVFDIPVERPKVRGNTETRWYDGRWQKLLRKGWVDA